MASSPATRRWLWPVAISESAGEAAWATARFALPVAQSGWLWPCALAAGVLPLVLGYSLGVSWHQLVSAVALTLLLLPLTTVDRAWRGVGALLLAFGAHAACAISLSAWDPTRAAMIMPDGAAYWAQQQAWIHTGHDPEYELVNWLPAHVQLFLAISLFSYVSLAVVPLFRGFYEVDLMNFYVGRMLAEGDGAPASLLVGWHPWSVMRGLCYAVLIFEVTSFSLERLTNRSLSTARRRMTRWGVAGGFFLADCAIKITSLESVRRVLEIHLGA